MKSISVSRSLTAVIFWTFTLLSGGFFLQGCVPPSTPESQTQLDWKLDDPGLRQILNITDRLAGDSLLPYLSHTNPTYRYAAAMGFARIKDSVYIDTLGALLNDPVDEVAATAAFALGQTGHPGAAAILLKNFKRSDSLAQYPLTNPAILEAIGKCAEAKYLDLIATTKSYLKSDTLLVTGQARAIYQYLLRGITSNTGTNKMVEIVTKPGYPPITKGVAAAYLQRAPNIDLAPYAGPLLVAFKGETNPSIRIPLATVLGKTRSNALRPEINRILKEDADKRVVIAAIKGLGSLPYDSIKLQVYTLLENKNVHVAHAAAEFFYQHGIIRETPIYAQIGRNDSTMHWWPRARLLAAANKLTPGTMAQTKASINFALRQLYDRSATNPYAQAAAVQGLAEFGWNFRDIRTLTYFSKNALLRTTGVEALGTVLRNPGFIGTFRESWVRIKKEIGAYLLEAASTGDAGMAAAAAGILGDPKLDFKTLQADTSIVVLEKALPGFDDLKNLETYNELKKALNYFKGTNEPLKVAAYNHPINWRQFETIKKNQKVRINTSKGSIEFQLLTDDAPASVTNFTELVRSGFFDNKPFHRVVSNFVVQTGCPRGDGYGSLNHTIRSEFVPGLNYIAPGMVGMASAGNHTECSQWFITTVPTLHLDGRYTIFGQVTKGLDVVQQLLPGDLVNNVILE